MQRKRQQIWRGSLSAVSEAPPSSPGLPGEALMFFPGNPQTSLQAGQVVPERGTLQGSTASARTHFTKNQWLGLQPSGVRGRAPRPSSPELAALGVTGMSVTPAGTVGSLGSRTQCPKAQLGLAHGPKQPGGMGPCASVSVYVLFEAPAGAGRCSGGLMWLGSPQDRPPF